MEEGYKGERILKGTAVVFATNHYITSHSIQTDIPTN